MSRPFTPFLTPRRLDTKTFQITLNPTCGLPSRVCQEWRRKSFQDFPDALAQYRFPKTKGAAEAGAYALIQYLKKKQEEEGTARRLKVDDITAGGWIEKFTAIETSPRTGINASRNRPYSPDTVQTYRGYWDTHIKGDPFMALKMTEIEEEDVTEYITRLSVKKLAGGQPCGGTRTFAGVIGFIRYDLQRVSAKEPPMVEPFPVYRSAYHQQ